MTDFGETIWPTAAKAHRCEWCGETIPKGEQHAHFAGKWDTEGDENQEIQEGFTPYEHERPSIAAGDDPDA